MLDEGAHLGQGGLPVIHDVGAEYGDGPLGGLAKPGDGLHNGGLAGAVGAQQAHHLAPCHGEGDVPGPAAVAIDFGHMVQIQYDIQNLLLSRQVSSKARPAPEGEKLRGCAAM